ncbi:hypothetical protein FQV39_29670 [Bosea sp. F3-2]|uniref:hypothetical protein n=1 Tax=Bosea sp. F3-2 TaxID=2599640 RepID=UPI0011EC06B3|nr:hypothetical protein [Bosea sp. F3-2]QEL26309.1 hypothetical protein FQV39_29670 [Bosea sp. F3-2]
MKRANQLSRAARLAKMRREQEEARKEREQRFPKPQLVPEIDESNRDEVDQLEKPRQARESTTRGSNIGLKPPPSRRWQIQDVARMTSYENVILAFAPAT